MIIKRDPVKAAKADIADILRNHEWLIHRNFGPPINECDIDFDMLADLVYDIKQGRTFGRGAIN